MSIGRKTKTSYASAIIGISLVLFLLGTLGWIVINGRTLTRLFQEDIIVTANFHDNVKPESVQQMAGILEQQPFIKKVKVITKEEALEIANQAEGQDIAEFLGMNPLFASIELNLRAPYVNRDSLDKVRQFILQSNVVREVTYPEVAVESINRNFRNINLILGAISLLLFLVVVVLIDNTVRLAMYSNRFLIKTMQMVGATRYFISRPFDRRAVINGFLAGIIAVALLWLVSFLAMRRLPELRLLQDDFMMVILFTGMILTGILISLISTHRSVVKYLKTHIEDLY